MIIPVSVVIDAPNPTPLAAVGRALLMRKAVLIQRRHVFERRRAVNRVLRRVDNADGVAGGEDEGRRRRHQSVVRGRPLRLSRGAPLLLVGVLMPA